MQIIKKKIIQKNQNNIIVEYKKGIVSFINKQN